MSFLPFVILKSAWFSNGSLASKRLHNHRAWVCLCVHTCICLCILLKIISGAFWDHCLLVKHTEGWSSCSLFKDRLFHILSPQQAIEGLQNTLFLSNHQHTCGLGALLPCSSSLAGRKLDVEPFPSVSGCSSKEIQDTQSHCASLGPQIGQLVDHHCPALVYRLSYRRVMFSGPFF